jgi:hypothetical protein
MWGFYMQRRRWWLFISAYLYRENIRMNTKSEKENKKGDTLR